MGMRRFLCIGSIFAYALTALAVAQAPFPLPPDIDPQFWGRQNAPYALTMMVTNNAIRDGKIQPTHVSQAKAYRDASGRVRTESFYDSGKPMDAVLRDPVQDVTVVLKFVQKAAFVLPLIRPQPPPPGKGWTVEQLPMRVIAGYPAQGRRFRRTIPAESTGTGQPVTTVEDVWVSNELGVILEQTFDDPRTGTSTKTVTELEKTVPDPTLFTIPIDYAMQKPTPAGPPS
jgi:hypothetical protein